MEKDKSNKRNKTDKEMKCTKEKKLTWHLPRLRVMQRIIIYIITMIIGGISIYDAVSDLLSPIFSYIVDTVAACMLTVTCIYLIPDFIRVHKKRIKPWIEGKPFTYRLMTDVRFRTLFFTVVSFSINLLYAGFHGIYGILYHSWWFGTLSAYYIVLTFMRCSILLRERKFTENSRRREWKIFQHCGVGIIILDFALIGSVILVVTKDKGKTYQNLMIYAVAAYTFYKIIIAVIHLVRVRKSNVPSIATIRCIGFADALMSILSLQTAMFAAFDEGTGLKVWMNAITGSVVCFMILGLGIGMIVKSRRKMNQRN